MTQMLPIEAQILQLKKMYWKEGMVSAPDYPRLVELIHFLLIFTTEIIYTVCCNFYGTSIHIIWWTNHIIINARILYCNLRSSYYKKVFKLQRIKSANLITMSKVSTVYSYMLSFSPLYYTTMVHLIFFANMMLVSFMIVIVLF